MAVRLANRLRFVIEVLEALSEVWGADSVGMRICPGNHFNDLHDEDPIETYRALLQAVTPMGLGYLHVVRSPDKAIDAFALAQACFPDRGSSTTASTSRQGMRPWRPALQPPVSSRAASSRTRTWWHASHMDGRWPTSSRKTLYTPGPEGYTSYPAHSA